jgi:hypothetical protein
VDLKVDTKVSEEHTASIFSLPKRWYLRTSSHSFTSQKTNIDIFTAVRTSNLIWKISAKEAVWTVFERHSYGVTNHNHENINQDACFFGKN